MSHALTALSTFLSIRRTRGWSRDRLEAWQERKIEKWMRSCVSPLPAFEATTFSDLPIMDKATLMGNFASYNRPGITAAQGWAAFEGSRMIDGYHVGASTGTSGNRGLFVISDKERYAWLGAMLAKTLPDFWRSRSRVAVILPLHTRLYDAANGFGPLRLRFFDVTQGVESWHDALKDFAPTHIIAPPKILRLLAHTLPSPRTVFSGAEVLDPVDRREIERWAPVREIYMATEGLIGVSCEHGMIHLCEDIMRVEFEDVGALKSPIITDFRRTTQAMARYRMNDLVELGPCSCGLPHQAVRAVHGRQDDCLVIGGKMITPDVVRNAIVDASRAVTDFRVTQSGEDIDVVVTADAALVEAALGQVWQRFGIAPRVSVSCGPMVAPMDKKLRRVVRV